MFYNIELIHWRWQLSSAWCQMQWVSVPYQWKDIHLKKTMAGAVGVTRKQIWLTAGESIWKILTQSKNQSSIQILQGDEMNQKWGRKREEDWLLFPNWFCCWVCVQALQISSSLLAVEFLGLLFLCVCCWVIARISFAHSSGFLVCCWGGCEYWSCCCRHRYDTACLQTKPGVQWKVRVLNLLRSAVFFWDFLSWSHSRDLSKLHVQQFSNVLQLLDDRKNSSAKKSQSFFPRSRVSRDRETIEDGRSAEEKISNSSVTETARRTDPALHVDRSNLVPCCSRLRLISLSSRILHCCRERAKLGSVFFFCRWLGSSRAVGPIGDG